jgi:hypothetical protein
MNDEGNERSTHIPSENEALKISRLHQGIGKSTKRESLRVSEWAGRLMDPAYFFSCFALFGHRWTGKRLAKIVTWDDL